MTHLAVGAAVTAATHYAFDKPRNEAEDVSGDVLLTRKKVMVAFISAGSSPGIGFLGNMAGTGITGGDLSLSSIKTMAVSQAVGTAVVHPLTFVSTGAATALLYVYRDKLEPGSALGYMAGKLERAVAFLGASGDARRGLAAVDQALAAPAPASEP